MKEGIHPEYREVVFQDMANGFKFITRSTVHTRETIKMDDGKEYPLMKLDVTSESHPFYTGAQQRIIETGRVEKVPSEVRPHRRYCRQGLIRSTAPGRGSPWPQKSPGNCRGFLFPWSLVRPMRPWRTMSPNDD